MADRPTSAPWPRLAKRLMLATSLAVSLALTPTAEAEEPKSGGVLVVATTNDTPDLDIQKYISSSQHNALLPLFNGLVEKDWTADADFPPIVPALATEWMTSDDGRTYTFKLREGVTFHDGTPFNAGAADFNFKRMTDEAHPFYDPQVGATARGVLKGLQGSRAVDEYTFEIELNEPNSGFIEALASLPNYYIMSPAAFEEHGLDGIGQNAVGTGPFKLVEWVRGQRTVMDRNEDYWGQKPYVDRMVYRPIIEPAARAAALKAGEVAIAWDLPVDQVATLQADDRFQVYLRGMPATKVIECWQASGPFSDLKVRQAINMAIDRQTLAEAVLMGTAVPAYQLYGIGSASFDNEIDPIPYDPEVARAILSETEYGDGFSFFIVTSPENEPVAGALQAYEYVQANLAEIGVNMEIRVRDNAVFGETYMRPKADDECVTFDRGYDTDYILDMGYHGDSCVPNGMNNQCYSNPEVTSLMVKAYTADSIETWRDLHREAQRLIMADYGSIPLVHGLRPMAAQANLRNWQPAKAWLQYPGLAWIED